MLSSRINTDLTNTKGSKDQQSVRQRSKGEGVDKIKQLADMQKDKFQLARRNTIKTLLVVGCGFIICGPRIRFPISCIILDTLLISMVLIFNTQC